MSTVLSKLSSFCDATPQSRVAPHSLIRGRLRPSATRSLTVFLAVLAVFCLCGPICLADDLWQLKVVVNELDGASAGNTDNRQTDMNNILAQCDKHGIHIRVTIVKVKKNQDPKDKDGNSIAPGGQVPDNAAHGKLRDAAKADEVKDGGFKMWVGKGVKVSGSPANGGTIMGEPSSAVKEQDGINGDSRTWTHEMGHALGLDDKYGAGDENDLMYGYRKKASDGTASGSGLSKADCQAMLDAMKKLGADKDKTVEQKIQQIIETIMKWLQDKIVDTPGVTGTATDLVDTKVLIDRDPAFPINSAMYCDINVKYQFTTIPPPPVVYRIWLDLNNDMTYEAMIEEHLTSPTTGEAWLTYGSNHVLLPLIVQATSLLGSGETEAWNVPYETRLSCRVPLNMLPGMGSFMNVRVTSQMGTLMDEIGPEQVSTIPEHPMLMVQPYEALPGTPISVHGSGFTPSASFRILFNDQMVGGGFAGPSGEIMTGFPMPSMPPGDYLADVIDVEGMCQVAVLRVHSGLPNRISTALDHPDGIPIELARKIVTVYQSDQKRGWIEEEDRSSGVQFVADAPVHEGNLVTIFGQMDTAGSTRQFVVSSIGINPESGYVAPLVMTNKATGGGARNPFTPGVEGGAGLYNVGMLVSIAGTVTATPPGCFYVDDGSRLDDGSGNLGVRVEWDDPLTPIEHQFVFVTGIINNPPGPGGLPIRTIIPRSHGDVVPV